VRDALLLAGSGAWLGAGVALAHPVPALLALLGGLVACAGSDATFHRAVALLLSVGGGTAIALALPESVAAYQAHTAVVAMSAPLLTVALVDEDFRLRVVAASAATGAACLLVVWSVLRLDGAGRPGVQLLLMALAVAIVAAWSVLKAFRAPPPALRAPGAKRPAPALRPHR
jgi:hypothetical protein